jgi:predicted DCC family thiol-disulfide oxidoreductase YuxK
MPRAVHIGSMTRDPARPRSADVTVWFDGACPLCTAEIDLLRRLDRGRRLNLVDLRGDGSCPLDRAAMLARFHARQGDGPIVSGVRAFAIMWRQVTPFQPLGWIASLPGAAWLLEPLYGLFLKVRPWLARRLSR